MDIKFENNHLEKCANNDRYGTKKLGKTRYKKFKQRLDQLRASKTLEDVRFQPGRFHELTANRKGQWACDLDQPYRLIFVPQENPIPVDVHAKYLWVEIKAVEIIKIEDYH